MTRPGLVALLLSLSAVLTTALGACSDPPDEPTTADVLAELEGRALTPAEVAAREQVARLLCGLDDNVLQAVWSKLRPSQLEFQDFVFSRQCPQRNELYAKATGRFSVEG